ncbi:hypothetical protein [Actinomadura bangladeshensis]|nr:hypothetical protein [Actinomadura bangladeshensis]
MEERGMPSGRPRRDDLLSHGDTPHSDMWLVEQNGSQIFRRTML